MWPNRLVRAVGFEPTHTHVRGILSPLRLPFRHARDAQCLHHTRLIRQSSSSDFTGHQTTISLRYGLRDQSWRSVRPS